MTSEASHGGAGCPSTHTPMFPWLENAQVRRVLHFPQLDGRPSGPHNLAFFAIFWTEAEKTVGNTREPPGPEGGTAIISDIRSKSRDMSRKP